MCDKNCLTDQSDSGSLPLTPKELELNSILKLCIDSSEAFNSRFSSMLTPQQSFFLKILGDYSGLDSRILSFWRESPLFDSINPSWEINLSTDAFNLINADTKCHIKCMLYLIDLMKGRFKIKRKDEKFYMIKPLDSNLTSLFSIIVAEKYSIKCFKVLVGKFRNNDLEEIIDNTIEEFCANSKELQIMNMVDNEIICIERECIPSYIFKKNEEFIGVEFVNEKKENSNQIKTQIIERPKILKINYDEKVRERSSRSRPSSPGSRTIFKGKETSQLVVKKHRRTTSCFDKDAASKEDDYSSSIDSLKEIIEMSFQKYSLLLKLGESFNGNWTSIVLSYFERQLSVSLSFNLFSSLNLKWKIYIEQNILNVLKKLDEHEFILYLSKILKFAKGHVIEDYDDFMNLNKNCSQNFFVVPIILKNLNLKPIFSVLCIDISTISKDYEYRLKLIDFYSPENLENQIKDFKTSEKYIKVKEVWKKPGLTSLISLKLQQKIIPIYQLSQISIPKSTKLLFFLFRFPKDSTEINFFIETTHSESIIGTKHTLDDYSINFNTYLIEFQVNWSSNTSFILKFKKKSEIEYSKSKDSTLRIINSDDYQFFFEPNFNITPISSIKNPNLIYFEDHYLEFYNYLNFYKIKENSVELDYLIKSFYEIVHKNINNYSKALKKIVSYANSNLKWMDCNNIQDLYLILSILGLFQNFDKLNKGIETKSLENVFKTLDQYSKFLQVLKSKINYVPVILGLAKIFTVARIQNITVIKYFDNIFDLDSLFTIISVYLKTLKVYKILITPDEINTIVKYCSYFQDKPKNDLIILILESHITIDQLAKLIIYPEFENIANDIKIGIFFSAFENMNVSLKDLLRFLEFIKTNNQLYARSIITKEKTAELVDKCLFRNKNIRQNDFELIGRIIGNLHSEQYFDDEVFNEFLKKQILNFGFEDCKELFLLVPIFISEIFKDYFTRNIENVVSFKAIKLIQNCLDSFPNEIQKKTILCIFESYPQTNLMRMVEYVYKAKSSILKKCFKKVFIQMLLNRRNPLLRSETYDYLNCIKDSTKNIDNHVLFELLTGAPLYFSVSNQNLHEDIIENPKPNEHLQKILKSHDLYKNQKYFEEALSFIIQIKNKIQTKQMDLKTFELILNHNNEQNQIFLNYIQDAMNDLTEFENFKLGFLKIKEEVSETKKNFKQLVKIIYSPILIIPQISRAIKSYEWLLNKASKFNINEFVTPKQLLGLFQFFKFPFKSRIFKNCILKELMRPDANMDMFIDSAHKSIEIFLKSLYKLEYNKITIEEIENFVECIDSETLFEREINALSAGFQNVFKEYYGIDNKLKKIFTYFVLYRNYKQLFSQLTGSYKVLGLTLQSFENYVVLNSDHYSEKFSLTLAKAKTEIFRYFNEAQISCLNLFFNEVSNNPKLIYYLNSVREREKILWCEYFDETFDKDLSLELVENFSTLWSFFNQIKKSVKDFPEYLRKIVELLETKEFSCVIDLIGKCSFKVEAIKNFNNSLDTQENTNFSKIKMIHSDSRLKIKRKTNYLAKIFPKAPNGEYNSSKINSNELSILRDRALLSKGILEQRKTDKKFYRINDLKIYTEFISYVDVLRDYLAALNELGESLYENLYEKTEFFIKDGDINELKTDKDEKDKVLRQWGISLEEAKEKCYVINALNNEMMCLVDNFVYDRSKENLDKIKWVFKYANKKVPSVLNIKISPPDDISERLKYLVDFLNNLIDKNSSIELNSDREIEVKSNGSILLANTREFYRAVLSIYTKYHKIYPRQDLVLFCYRSTDWTELKRFLNRCALNPKKEIYTLINPESLSLENQKMFDSALSILIEKVQFFSLAIVTNDMSSRLVSRLKLKTWVKIESFMMSDEEISDLMMNHANNFLVVTSSFVGLGKSNYINNIAKDKDYSVIDINVSATYDYLDLLIVINDAIQTDPALYKINLNFLSDPEYFHKLIFELALFRKIYNDKTIIKIPGNSFIAIEVANTYNNNLYNSLPFLKLLPLKNISKFSLKKLVETEELIYVCNYLSLLDSGEIDETDLEYNTHSETVLFNDPITFSTLLEKYFIPICKSYPNYHQLNAFLKVLKNLLVNFEKSLFSCSIINDLIYDYQNQNMDIFSRLRSCIVNIIIETSKEFTTKCIESAKNNQGSEFDSSDVVKNEYGIFETSIKWENSNHFIMIFLTEDFSSIYRLPDMVPEFIKKFIISQKIITDLREENFDEELEERWEDCKNGNGDIEDYNSYDSSELILKLLEFYKQFSLDRAPRIEENEIVENVFQRCLNDAQSTGYILTPDNYLKMNLIYLRCMSNLPLIIMGETGCGKTSLLRFFVEKILRETLLIVYINSEIKVSDIQEELEKANYEASVKENCRVWVFFDEFNTSDCISEIITIFCERKFEGLELHPNLVFVGACNPYRVKLSINYKENVGIKKKKTSKLQLVHLVKPLPDKAFEFIWDFGVLKPHEIEKYVKSMLLLKNIEQIDFFTKIICTAHLYFQNNEDYSSVSLRDVNRFVLLCEWFDISIKMRESIKVKNPSIEYQECYDIVHAFNFDKNILAPLLSFIHCYYLRLSTEDQRNVFIDFIVFEASNCNIEVTSDQIHSLIKFQELDFISRMNVPKYVALNKALIENVFAIVPCILSKIPIFICGKPGTSKSLAVNIIFSSLRGKNSSDDYFKTFPNLHVINFLGSESCTSEDIEQVFEKAFQSIEEHHYDEDADEVYNENILPVVLFDEIGLAENAKGNPLKVLHKLLEYENCKVSFIGLSNWRIDASKMNRALYLARPDPDEDDLIKTALAIFSSIIQGTDFEQYLLAIKYISKGYYNMKKDYSLTDFPDFFGLRDFYSTIKSIALSLKKTQFNTAIQQALYRNFDGLPNSLNDLNKYFSVYTRNKTMRNPIQLIENNLLDPNSRYLIIICAQDVSDYLKNKILCKYLPEYRLMVGSTFQKDLIQEESKFKSLSDVIGYMKHGVSVIMQDMDSIYNSLYSLFNHNFTMIGSRSYCSVALGSHYSPKCYVHENFKAVVFLDNDESFLKNVDAPFLNRFEKHSFAIIDILDEDETEISNEICRWAQDIVTIRGKENRLSITSVFPVFSKETINLFIALNENTFNKNQKLKRFLLQNASMDVVLLCRINILSDTDKINTVGEWKKLHGLSLENYFCKLVDKQRYLKKNKTVKMISVTYDRAKIKFVDKNLYKSVTLEKLDNINCEEVLRKSFKTFLNDPEKVLYVLELYYNKESHHLRFIINLIESISQIFIIANKNTVKNVFILVRQKRCDYKRKPLLLFKNWRYKMFETLSGKADRIINEIIERSIKSIVQKDIILDKLIKNIVRKSVETLALRKSSYSHSYFTTFKENLSNFILNNFEILEEFKKKILSSIDRLGNEAKEKWLVELFVNEKFTFNAISITDEQKEFISHNVFIEFTKLLVACEKISGLGSLLSTSESNIHLLLWMNTFKNLSTNTIQVQVKPDSNNIQFSGEYKLPFFYHVYIALKQKYQALIEKDLDENLIQVEFNNFYLNKTIWRENSALFFENEEFEKYFIREFIEISLIEIKIEERQTIIINKFIFSGLRSIDREFRLKYLFDNQLKIISFNKLILLYMKHFDNKEWIIELLVSSLPFEDIMEKLFDEVILQFFSLKNYFYSEDDLKLYAQDINELEIIILNFISSLELENLYLIEFMVKLCKLDNRDLYNTISEKLSIEGHTILFESNTVAWICDTISETELSNEFSTYRFKVFYLNKVLQKNLEMIPFIINEIENDETWKYSGELLLAMFEYCDLKEILFQIEVGNKDFNTVLNEKNLFLYKLNEAVENLDLFCPFCVLFTDTVKSIKFNISEMAYGKVTKQYMDYIETSNHVENKLKLLIAIGRTQFYLNEFIILINSKIKIKKPSELAIINTLTNLLQERDLLTYELYCLKVFNALECEKILKLKECIQNSDYKWRINYNDIEDYTRFYVFIFAEDIINSTRYENLICKIGKLSENLNALDDEIKAEQDCLSTFEFGLAFLNTIYLKKSQVDLDMTAYIIWYKERKNLLIQHFSREFAELIKKFIENYPRSSFCYIYLKIEQVKFNIAMVTNYLALITISYSKFPNCFSSQFFKVDGQPFDSISERSKEIFFIGAEVPKMQEYLKSTQENFESIKSTTFYEPYSKGGSNVCSDNCDYLYIIGNCGGPTEESTCPFCGNIIGGLYHVMVERPGHRNLSDDEAKEFLDERCEFYKQLEPKGFNRFFTNLSLARHRKLEHKLTLPLLNFFTNSMFYYLLLAEVYEETELRAVYNINIESLQAEIENILTQNYRELQLNQNGKDFSLWVLGAVNKLREIMQEYNGDCGIKETRDEFEKCFEDRTMTYGYFELTNEYKLILNTQNKAPAIIEYIEEVKLPTEDYFKFTNFFRYTSKPTFDIMANELSSSRNYGDFKLLTFYYKEQSSLKNLVYLWPIIKFSREMINECSFEVSRAEAKVMKMKELLVEKENLRESFEEFCNAWNSLNITLQIGCKRFDMIQITEDTPIGYLLIDTQINSLGIYLAAGIFCLFELQNKIRALLEPKNNEDFKKIEFAHISKDDIFYLPPDELDSLVKKASINSFEYGKGQEIFFNYNQLDNDLRRILEKSKFLDNKNLEIFQFKYELLYSNSRHSGIINEIRIKIRQIPLDDSEADAIKRDFLLIAENWNVETASVWGQAYNWLGKAIIHVRYSNLVADDYIENYNSIVLKVRQNFMVHDVFKRFKVGQFISIYELVELQIYHRVVRSVDQEYKIEYDNVMETKQIINEFSELVCNEFSVEVFNECHNVIKRIIIRLLTAVTDSTLNMKSYIYMESFWSSIYLYASERIGELFPTDFIFTYAVEIEKLFEARIRDLKDKL